MDALKACCERLQTATEQLEAACRCDTETGTDLLMDKLGSLRVSVIVVPSNLY